MGDGQAGIQIADANVGKQGFPADGGLLAQQTYQVGQPWPAAGMVGSGLIGGDTYVPTMTLTGGDAGSATAKLGAEANLEQMPKAGIIAASSASDANLIIGADGKATWNPSKPLSSKDNYQCKVWIDEAAKGNQENIQTQLETAKADLAQGINVEGNKKLALQTDKLPDSFTAKTDSSQTKTDESVKDETSNAQTDEDKNSKFEKESGGGGGCGGGGCSNEEKINGKDGSEGKGNNTNDGTEGGSVSDASRSTDFRGLSESLAKSTSGINPISVGNFFGRVMPAGMYSAFSAIGSADLDGDGKISPEEQAAYDERVKNFQKYQEEHPDEVKQFKDNMDNMSQPLTDLGQTDSANAMQGMKNIIADPLANKESIGKLSEVGSMHLAAKDNPSLMNKAYLDKMQSTIQANMPALKNAIADRAAYDLAQQPKFKLDLKGLASGADEAAITQYQATQDRIQAELEINAHKF